MGHEATAEKHLGTQAAQRARDLRVTSLVDRCRAALAMDGRVVPSGREAMIHAALRAGVKNCMLGNPTLFKGYTQVLQYKIFELKAHDSVPLVELF